MFDRSSRALGVTLSLVLLLFPVAARAQGVPPSGPATGTFEVLHSFMPEYGTPLALARGVDGVLYGTTYDGGAFGKGVVFSLSRDASGAWARRVIHSVTPSEGTAWRLAAGDDGHLYVSTYNRDVDCGNILRVEPGDGRTEVAHTFVRNTSGCGPTGRLLAEADGLYGTADTGGPGGSGTVYKLSYEGGLTVLYAFGGSDGAFPSSVTRGIDGNLYGLAAPMIFRITTAGAFSVVGWCEDPVPDTLVQASNLMLYATSWVGYMFSMDPRSGALSYVESPPGLYDQCFLTVGADGEVYGVSPTGGAAGRGLVFKGHSAPYTVLHEFTAAEGTPFGPMVATPDGDLLGMTGQNDYWAHPGNRGVIYRISRTGEYAVETELGTDPQGLIPSGALAQGSDGQWYGTTVSGGAFDGGTFFKITPAGELTTLHHFPYGGGVPTGLVKGRDGNFYGAERWRGEYGYGALYRLTPAGDVWRLRSFGGWQQQPDSRAMPQALALGADGTVYGAVSKFGSSRTGEIYAIDAGGELRTVAVDPLLASAWLTAGSDGALYGINEFGVWEANGTQRYFAFRAQDGTVSAIREFNVYAEGMPTRMTRSTDGALYGLTYPVTASQSGTIFRITTAGEFHTVFTFITNTNGMPGDSSDSLVCGPDGRLYGVTWMGVRPGDPQPVGTPWLFEFDPATGAMTLLSALGPPRYRGRTDLSFGPDGWIYGVASNAGTSGYGIIFRVRPTLPDTTPPVVTVPATITVEATSASGTVVTYAASATDDVDGVVAASCVPASGTTFPWGSSLVTCSAVDASGNRGYASFTVIVQGPSQITSNLLSAVAALNFPQGEGLLASALANLEHASTGAACNQLNAFANQVRAQSGKRLSVAEAAALIRSAGNAMASLSCR